MEATAGRIVYLCVRSPSQGEAVEGESSLEGRGAGNNRGRRRAQG